MKYTKLKPNILLFVSMVGIVSLTNSVWAQDQSLSIILFSPPEGATFYAGPTSLAYNIPISGRVDSQVLNLDQIEIQLDIIQNHRVLVSQSTSPHPDGTFEFYVMVNPEGSGEVFGPDILYCADACHFKTELSFPNGPVQVKVTATGPHAEQASVTRHITIDRSNNVNIPVQVINFDDPTTPIAGLPVLGSTWIYLWRARHATQATNDQGFAFVQVEALSQTHTRYIFRVEPTILDGVLYEGIEPMELVLPAGATSSESITIMVDSRMGSIKGRLITKDEFPVSPISLWAIHLPEGISYHTNSSKDNSFTFNKLPIGNYILAADGTDTVSSGFTIEKQTVSLDVSGSEEVRLKLTPMKGYSLNGSVLDTSGQPIPFAWITVDDMQAMQSAGTGLGTYHIHGLPSKKERVVVRAPGYYSQARFVDLPSNASIDFTLKIQPETQNMAWGSGSLIIPAESSAYYNDQIIVLEYGWLWGKNNAAQLLALQMGNHEIFIKKGAFAIEYLPGKRGWIYISEGSAEIQTKGVERPVDVLSGEMANLLSEGTLVPVNFSSILIDVMQSSTPQVNVNWEPTLTVKIRDQLTHLGINLAQAVTLVVYIIAITIIIALPVVGVYWWKRNKN